MRKYYLSVAITCDKCGISDTLDDGSSVTEDSLEAHIKNYYIKKDGKDLCEDCSQEDL